jgi:hypothetical protein
MEVAEEGYSKACEVRASGAYQTYVSIARASVTQIEPAFAASARLEKLGNTAHLQSACLYKLLNLNLVG